MLPKVCKESNYAYSKLSLSEETPMEKSKMRTLSPLIWIPLAAAIFLLFFVDFFEINIRTTSTIQPFTKIKFNNKALVGFAINTPGCKIPDMDPFDEHVMKFIEVPKKIVCNKGIPALFKADLSSISLRNSSLSAYNITDVSQLNCCYRVIWRKDPKKDENDDKITYSKTCQHVSVSALINDEFIELTCKYENVSIYKDLFSFVPLKNTSNITHRSDHTPLNVLLIGLDAVSRINLHRQMPKTVGYLQELKAAELLGYNKVADNTFPNLIPVLTGLSQEELRNACIPEWTDHFDDCHFIWQDYKKKGFLTAYGEDSSWMGLFNYQRRGFIKQSVDYGYSYFNRISEKTIGNSHNWNVDECIGGRPVYKDLLEYIQKFITTMDTYKFPYFGFFWGVSLSHDYLNKPQLGDGDYLQFFKNLNDSGHLNNTVLIFMSDHGIRWGGIRQTYQGRMEERLPFVIMLLPEWYQNQFQKAYNNLKINTRRLTSNFDLYETIVDLLNPFELNEEYLKTTNPSSRGISLFREISKKRTCTEAGIEGHWCTCQQTTEINNSSEEVRTVANFAVKYMNKELDGYAQCAALTIKSILNARITTYTDHIEKGDKKIHDYLLTIQTVPGEGIFEVTVRPNLSKTKYQVIGTISRLNLYGQQSACITDFHLKLYCYCTNLLT